MKVIGIITVPIVIGQEESFNYRGNSTISSGHIEWLGDEYIWTAIPYQSSKQEMDRFIDSIHAFYIPSGNVGKKSSNQYLNIVKYAVELIKQKNDNGIFFPIWGVCMGLQTLLAVENNVYHHDDLLDQFDTWKNYLTPLQQINQGKLTDFFTCHERRMLETTHDKIHNHRLGLSPLMFNSTSLKQNYKIIHINVDRKGQPFASTVEHKKYPFYGFQWHPEKSPNCDMFKRFFRAELEKTPNTLSLQYEINHGTFYDCLEYSRGIYDNCYFFHK
jgi:gamma-glutamyl hydrolase